ncbi:hypothetical protein Hanom_Chr11g00973421 [Helianthus anomalus]
MTFRVGDGVVVGVVVGVGGGTIVFLCFAASRKIHLGWSFNRFQQCSNRKLHFSSDWYIIFALSNLHLNK